MDGEDAIKRVVMPLLRVGSFYIIKGVVEIFLPRILVKLPLSTKCDVDFKLYNALKAVARLSSPWQQAIATICLSIGNLLKFNAEHEL